MTCMTRGALGAIALLTLGGCANLPEDLGRGDVDALVEARGHAAAREADGATIGVTPGEVLSADEAVRVAFVNNPRLKAAYARLGFAAADVYAAARIRNPVFSAALLDASAAGARDQVTFGLVASFTDLITLPARKRLAAAAFAETKQAIGAEVLAVAASAERAYHAAVGANNVVVLREQIARAARLSAELAARFHAAGNLTPRDLALEQAAATEARLALLGAAAAATAARAALASALGLDAGADWALPQELELPLESEEPLGDVLALARSSRLDLAAARAAVERHADRLGVTNWTRWLGEVELGAERERETDGSFLTGGTARLELPVFTQHRDRLLRADADLALAAATYETLALEVDNAVYLQHATVRNARARVAEYRDNLIPQRAEAVRRAQEQQHYMLIGVFELLAEKQREYDAYQGYVEAVRDYWTARAELGRAAGTTLPSARDGETRRLDTSALIAPVPAAASHDTARRGGLHSTHGEAPAQPVHGAHHDRTTTGGHAPATPAPASPAGHHEGELR